MNPSNNASHLCEVNFKVSRYYLMIIVLSHIAAAVAVWLASLSLAAALLLTAVLLVHLGYNYWHYAYLRQSFGLTAIRLLDGQWRVCTNGRWVRAWPKGEVVATSLLICLKLRLEGNRKTCYLILFSDSANQAELHALRLRLLLDRSALASGQNESSPVLK
ncbi:MAG: protein YgfX [Endozoicomonas sp.]